MAGFFIRRPIVAIVIAILTVLLGTYSLLRLSFEQYPFLAPPTIRVTANYPGASALAVEQSVATPIEQEVNGVDRMIYMKSSNTSDGRMLLDVNFEVGVDQDTANVLTQNRGPSAPARLPPDGLGQAFTFTVSAPGRLVTTDEFENIIIRESSTGSVVRIRDVGRAELGSQDYNSFGRLNGKPSGAMAVYLLPGANQLKASEAIYKTMATAKNLFPPGLDYKIVYDTTPAVEASIHEIVKTFVEALILVTLVVFIFLQNVRATIIPLLTVPVSIVGTFIFFPLLGFSVNTLSMFGLVLAIGIVVDDAIVVVEAVMHHIEHGMSPRDATSQAMKEVSAPVIGIALILSAVFVPVAFLGGLTGQMYQQFALTIAISVLLSAFSALSLSPALSAMLLKPARAPRGPLGVFFRGFNRVFDTATTGYIGVARLLIRRAVVTILLVGVVVVGVGPLGRRIPAGFIPDEDQGLFGVAVQLPPAASLERTSAMLRKVEEILAKVEAVDSYQTIGGYGAVTSTYQPNFGSIFVRLKPWEERHEEALHVKGIMARVNRELVQIPEAVAFPFNIPTISGFGAAAGFNFLLQDRSGSLTVDQLGAQTRAFLAAARQRPEFASDRKSTRLNSSH